MAQVSIQYALECPVNKRDEQRMKTALKEVTAIHNIELNTDSGILCVDFDDRSISEQELKHRITAMNYPVFMIDAIMF